MAGFLNSGLTKIMNEIKSINPKPVLELARSNAILGAGVGAAGGAGLAALQGEDIGGILKGGIKGAAYGGAIGGAYGAYKGVRPQLGAGAVANAAETASQVAAAPAAKKTMTGNFASTAVPTAGVERGGRGINPTIDRLKVAGALTPEQAAANIIGEGKPLSDAGRRAVEKLSIKSSGPPYISPVEKARASNPGFRPSDYKTPYFTSESEAAAREASERIIRQEMLVKMRTMGHV